MGEAGSPVEYLSNYNALELGGNIKLQKSHFLFSLLSFVEPAKTKNFFEQSK